MRTSPTALALAALLLAGCTGDGSTGPEIGRPGDAFQAQLAVEAADISGEWSWSSENFIHLSAFAAEFLFGFEPEGERTTLRCAHEGTLTLVQDGSTFAGSTSTQATCETRGGQTADFPPGGVLIVGGTILGRSIQFTAMDGPVECPARGTIRTEDGAAVALSGTQVCVEPGHPQSAWPAPPPRMGPNRTLWEATR
jgi:hypothetical protein